MCADEGHVVHEGRRGVAIGCERGMAVAGRRRVSAIVACADMAVAPEVGEVCCGSVETGTIERDDVRVALFLGGGTWLNG